MSRAWPRQASVALLPAILFVLLALMPRHATAQELKVLNLEHYGEWSGITQVALSPDGRWMTFAYQPNDGDGTLFMRDLENLGMSPVEMGTNGTGPVFSEDSRWLAFFTTPPEEEAESLREQRKPIPRTLHLLNIRTEERIEMENAASITFSEDSRWLAVQKTRPQAGGGDSSAPAGRGGPGGGRGGPGGGGMGDNDDQPRGADLILRDLSTGTMSNVGNVAEYAFNDAGAMLDALRPRLPMRPSRRRVRRCLSARPRHLTWFGEQAVLPEPRPYAPDPWICLWQLPNHPSVPTNIDCEC